MADNRFQHGGLRHRRQPSLADRVREFQRAGHGGQQPGDRVVETRVVCCGRAVRPRLGDRLDALDVPVERPRWRELSNPIVDQRDALLIHEARADGWHVARAGGSQAIEQRRSRRVARRDDPCVGDPESPLAGRDIERAGGFQRHLEIELDVGRSSAAKAVTGPAVDVEICPPSIVERS
jgi:hypothetical protein